MLHERRQIMGCSASFYPLHVFCAYSAISLLPQPPTYAGLHSLHNVPFPKPINTKGVA